MEGVGLRAAYRGQGKNLAKRLFLAVLPLPFLQAIGLVYFSEFLTVLSWPLNHAWSLLGTDVSTGATTALLTYFDLISALVPLSLLALSPWIFLQAWLFLGTPLPSGKKTPAMVAGILSFCLFAGTCLIGYFVLTPYALYVLGQMMTVTTPDGESMIVLRPLLDFDEYLGLLGTLTALLGFVVQAPVVMVYFARIGAVQPRSYIKWGWAWALSALILAAFVTPLDIFTTLIAWVVFMIIFALGVFGACFAYVPGIAAGPSE